MEDRSFIALIVPVFQEIVPRIRCMTLVYRQRRKEKKGNSYTFSTTSTTVTISTTFRHEAFLLPNSQHFLSPNHLFSRDLSLLNCLHAYKESDPQKYNLGKGRTSSIVRQKLQRAFIKDHLDGLNKGLSRPFWSRRDSASRPPGFGCSREQL